MPLCCKNCKLVTDESWPVVAHDLRGQTEMTKHRTQSFDRRFRVLVPRQMYTRIFSVRINPNEPVMVKKTTQQNRCVASESMGIPSVLELPCRDRGDARHTQNRNRQIFRFTRPDLATTRMNAQIVCNA